MTTERLADAVAAAGPLLGTAPEAVAEALGWRALRDFGGDGVVADAGVADVHLRGRLAVTEVRATLVSTPDGRASIVDAFADAAAALRQRFGSPASERPGAWPAVTWRLPRIRGSGLLWRRRHATLTLCYSPDARGVELAVRSDDEADRLAAAAVAAAARAETAASPPPPGGWADGDWARFTDTLTAELADLEPDHVVILADRTASDAYVQFMQFEQYSPPYLTAETISDHFRDDHRQLTPDQRQRLTALGWEPPDGAANWTRHLEWPARWDGYHRLADLTVATLRDVHGTRSPADLVLGGWGYDHTRPPPFPRLGLATR
ncbi:DUF6301 family protein [Virgisporangium ochraceum]|uniref:TY-Chap N-terminal domain-containing protein n=1 Tax=Virgisporangium ochraceum TaxID=65505 RepID=A0A8J4A0Q5_9ACTN|nr:DUF6301 family protein [Virgisporangium ochraceum]GIJ70985.1 hypothetical protein Voc01_059020 [Virgisporangium ochraceum]